MSQLSMISTTFLLLDSFGARVAAEISLAFRLDLASAIHPADLAIVAIAFRGLLLPRGSGIPRLPWFASSLGQPFPFPWHLVFPGSPSGSLASPKHCGCLLEGFFRFELLLEDLFEARLVWLLELLGLCLHRI